MRWVLENNLKKEFKRKAFHFLSFLYALGYAAMGKDWTLKVLGAILLIEASLEFGRFLSPGLNSKLLSLFGGIHRPEESARASGIFWTMLGSWLTMFFVTDPNLVLCAMGYLIFSDAAAALAGVKWGRHRAFKKSLEGTAAFICCSLVVGTFFLPPLPLLAGALFAAAVELFPLPYNDNLWVPLLSGLFLTLIT